MLRFHHNASWAHILLPDEICNALRLYNAWICVHGINNENLLQSFHTPSSLSSQQVECEISVTQYKKFSLFSIVLKFISNLFIKMYRSTSVLLVRCVCFYGDSPSTGAVYCAFVLE